MAEMHRRAEEEGFRALNRTSSSFRQKLTMADCESSEWTSKSAAHFMSEQVMLGPKNTLPKTASLGTIATAREDALVYSLRERIPRELAATSGEAGQMLRRVLLHGSTIVFVTPGYAGKRFIYERARELGVESVIIDEPGSWAESLVADRVIRKFIPLNLERDSETVFADALKAIQALEHDPDVNYRRPAGICTFCELSVPLAARLSEAMGLPGPAAAAVDIAREKHRTRLAMVAAGLPSPACAKISGPQDLDDAAAAVGFPAVLKPLSGAASLGVIKVLSEEALHASYAEVVAEMRATVVSSGALIKKNVSACDAQVPPPTFMLEQYLDGPEVDVDVVMADGEAQYAVVVDNGPTAEPYFAETWGLCPSRLPTATQDELRALAVASLKSCGFECGVFHVELKQTSKGPRLIEINARMGGGQVRQTHMIASGVDLVEETLFTAVGIPCRPHSSVPLGSKCVAYCYVTSTRSGRVQGLRTVLANALEFTEGAVYAKPLVDDDAEVVGSKDGLPTWVADVMATADSPDAAIERAIAMADALRIESLIF